MTKPKNNTFHASASRTDNNTLQHQKQLFVDNLVTVISNTIPTMLVVLNKERQIVFANDKFTQAFGSEVPDDILGKRPGEAINCIHSENASGGCGTSIFCTKCGAVNAILESQQNQHSVKECKIITKGKKALDLEVTAAPLPLFDDMFTLFSITDISDKKRRKVLERTFFHDVLNIAGGLNGLSSVLSDTEVSTEARKITELIQMASEQLLEEIQSQSLISNAEQEELMVEIETVNSYPLLRDLVRLYSSYSVGFNRKIILSEEALDIPFQSDPKLIRRILGNMLKNSLEAIAENKEVKVNCYQDKKLLCFSVYNNTYIPKNIQLQLFKRSFSTKGAGRGIGTYSMKLLGEQYLKGKVSFTSDKETGTTFFLKLKL